ncbi:VirB2 family type IV secretion system major pilin TrwL [Bartonella taylorii]|uniref:VirB2 family type IV secretion system major pilin TrwL n=1 Tax=Bartonella taylorii TaxID=33046 RepID=UPI001ABB974B|nr:VirB2 family type IV secretion system major pilin TrwL [Bartonella taylorii]
MKKTNTLKTTVRNKIIATTAAVVAFFIVHPVYAQQALAKAKTALESLDAQLKIIIPIAAAVILLCLAIGYAGRYIGKDTFVRWAIGVVIAGSATELVTMLFKTP